MRITLHIWRQKNSDTHGDFVTYERENVDEDMSFLEMLDDLNEHLINMGSDPVAFDHDCREGICGSCGLVIDGAAHGPRRATTACQLHMRSFKDGDVITVEPWRSTAFRSSGTWWLTGVPLTVLFRPGDSSPCPPAPRRMPMPFR